MAQRVIDVPAAITLDELHDVLQLALGWTDSHLHQFRTGDAVYSMPSEDWDEETDERGVRLSARLPRGVVRAVQQQRPSWYPLGRPASIEEDLLPLARLHDILRHVGLLRLARGVLRPTKPAGDSAEIVRRLRTWFPPREFSTMVAERAVALVAARGPLMTSDLAAEVLAMLGHGWRRGSDPITVTDVQDDLYRLEHQLAAVDMLTAISPSWTAGPSARSLLPGVALLADLV